MKTKKTFCPYCQIPKSGYIARICAGCKHRHMHAIQQDQVRDIGGRILHIGGKVKRQPGCP